MNKDIRLDLSFWGHRKRKKLFSILGAQGVLSLIDLWLKTAESRTKGILTGMDEADIALDAQWPGDPAEFCKVMIDTGFLDRDKEGTYSIHDWREHQPFAFFAEERSRQAREAAEAKWGSKMSDKKTRSQRMAEARRKGDHTEEEWQTMKTFFNACVKCDGESNLANVDRDHIIPIYQGGSHGIDNIQPLCAKCNSSKGADNQDYRLKFCAAKGIIMPTEWVRGAGIQQGTITAPSPIPSPIPLKTSLSSSQMTCPQDEIVELYHRVLPELPAVKHWTEERQKNLRARWKEEPKRQNLEWWEKYFQHIQKSPFLMGNGKEKWQPNLEWLIKKANLINVIEGKYHGST